MARPQRSRPSRRTPDDDSSSNGWLTTYADAVTLLMAFFVLLYAMSEVDVAKFAAFVEGLQTPFGNDSADGLLPDDTGLDPDADPTRPPPEPDHGEGERDDPDLADIDPGELTDALDLLEARQAARDQLDEISKQLTAALEARGLDRYVEQRREERGLVVSIASDDILFATGSTVINDTGAPVIEVVADTLAGYPNPLHVEGHTDNQPLDRDGYTNWNLSTDRAVAVLSRMIEQHQLPADQVAASGYGEQHPLDDNTTRAGRARNRRVDIVVLVEHDRLHTGR